MVGCRLTIAAAIAIAIMGGNAWAQNPQERVFVFHSNKISGCPGLDWYVVFAPDNSVFGMFGTQNMQIIAHVNGTANPQNKTFELVAAQPLPAMVL